MNEAEREKQSCPFCSPRQRILKRNEHAYVLLSDPRKVAGHALVLPHRHVEKPWELSPTELSAIFELIGFVQRTLLSHGAEGIDVRQNYRPFLAQSKFKVDHVHFHVMPRAFEDKMYQVVDRHDRTLFEDLSPEEEASVGSWFIN